MKITGNYVFDAPAARVWDALLNPGVLVKCMPGCERLEPVGDDQYRAVMSLGIGPVRGKYDATISIKDKNPTQSYRLVIAGSGAGSFANGESLITLAEQGGQTTVTVESDAEAGGTIVRVGQRMMGSVAKSMMDRMFNCLRESVG